MKNFKRVVKKLLVPFFLFNLLMLFFLHAESQENFTKGYIVTPTGDTSHGYIDYRGWDKNPKSIQFKSEPNAAKISFPSTHLKAFAVATGNGYEIYRSFAISFIRNSEELSKLQFSPEPEWDSTHIFLLLLEDGAMSLYKYEGPDSRVHFFIDKETGLPKELINHTYLDNNHSFLHDARFRQQLKQFTSDCSQIRPFEIDALEYKEKAVVKMVNRYNTCKQVITYSIKKEANPVRLFLTGGIHYSLLHSEGNEPFNTMKYDGSIGASAGATIQFVLPRQNKKLSILLEALLRTQNIEGSTTDFKHEQNYTEYTFDIKANYLRLTPFFRYEFIKYNQKPFIQLGFSNAFALSFKNNLKEHRVLFSSNTENSEPVKSLSRKHEQGIVFGGGMNFNRSGIEARMEASNGFSEAVSVKTALKTFSVLYSFRL